MKKREYLPLSRKNDDGKTLHFKKSTKKFDKEAAVESKPAPESPKKAKASKASKDSKDSEDSKDKEAAPVG